MLRLRTWSDVVIKRTLDRVLCCFNVVVAAFFSCHHYVSIGLLILPGICVCVSWSDCDPRTQCWYVCVCDCMRVCLYLNCWTVSLLRTHTIKAFSSFTHCSTCGYYACICNPYYVSLVQRNNVYYLFFLVSRSSVRPMQLSIHFPFHFLSQLKFIYTGICTYAHCLEW